LLECWQQNLDDLHYVVTAAHKIAFLVQSCTHSQQYLDKRCLDDDDVIYISSVIAFYNSSAIPFAMGYKEHYLLFPHT